MTPSVLLIGNFLSGSGANRGICEDLAAQLAGAGWPVVTASSRTMRLPRLADMLATAWRSRGRYDVAQVDVFSGRSFLWAEAVCRLLRHARKPFVLTLHGGNLPVFARRQSRRVAALLRSAAAVTTPSGYLLEQMRPYREDLQLLPNPIDLRAYPFRRRDRPVPALLWLRAFHRIYNPALAPRAAALLAGRFPAVRLTMAGPDKGDGTLDEARRAAGALDIAFPGAIPKSEVGAALDQADVFLNTADVDNAPVSVLEAMACGMCIVSTNVGGIPYLLEHERDALLVPPRDPEAMAAAAGRFLAEPELAARLSAAARDKAEQFDWPRVLPQWQALLASAARNGTS